MNDLSIETPNEEEFKLFQHLIERELGIYLPSEKKVMLGNRLWKRVVANECASYRRYYRLICRVDNAKELARELELITTNETFFFREKKHFQFLEEELPQYFQQYKKLKVWSAACSTGEEPYSIAMTLMNTGYINSWSVMASDVNKKVLQKAKDAIYLDQRTQNIPPDYRKKYFQQGIGEFNGYIRVKPEVRKRVAFLQCNLSNDFSHIGLFDVVFLRNVLIYFSLERKKDILQRVSKQMKKGGVLFTGHSESLHGLVSDLKCICPAIYLKQ
ncbi:CheR family methyltransferase [Aliikangiella sp. IMCC44359]|uniref:CheR family methyltransferase n=1 Tax=Aliikangiella sp. IMCC44359 TaxID=3459125 RepID=UPI00403AA2B6